jgi:hypothetical protein
MGRYVMQQASRLPGYIKRSAWRAMMWRTTL